MNAEWPERLRRACVHYIEENEVANLEAILQFHVHGDKHND